MMDDLQGKMVECSTKERSHVTPMKPLRLIVLATLLLGCVIPMAADQITFSFVSAPGNVQDVNASISGLTAGPAINTSVTDSTTGVIVPLSGNVTMSTGTAITYDVFPTVAVALFNGGTTNSVLVEDPITHAILLSGVTNQNSTMVATHPGGTGAFLAGFKVTFVDPAILSAFGLMNVDPRGSLGLTFGQDQLVATKDIVAVAGGGTITITATSAIPEPFSMALLGGGILVAGFTLRRGSRLC